MTLQNEAIKAGSRVKWTSQANGTTCTKVGIVVLVILLGERIWMKNLDLSMLPTKRHHRSFSLQSTPRPDRETYVVSVKTGVTDRAKRTLYHPRRVELAGPGDADGVWPA